MKDQDQTEESQPYYNVFHVLLGGVSTRQLHTSIDSLIGATTVSCPLLHFLNPSKTLGFKAGSSATDHIIWMLKQGIISSYCGLGLGALLGARRASLVYLAENAHRMPVTKGGWYMYHKHRNYAIIRGAARRALPTGAKWGLGAVCFCLLEWFGEAGFAGALHLDTTAESAASHIADSALTPIIPAVFAGLSSGISFSLYNRLWKSQGKRAIMMATGVGFGIGCLESLHLAVYQRPIKQLVLSTGM